MPVQCSAVQSLDGPSRRELSAALCCAELQCIASKEFAAGRQRSTLHYNPVMDEVTVGAVHCDGHETLLDVDKKIQHKTE